MRVVEISYLPCLASGHNLILTSEYMADLRRQVISGNDDNNPSPQNIPAPENIPLPQLEEAKVWGSEGIIFLRLSNNLHNTNASFKKYYRKGVMKMMNLDFFYLIYF